MAPLLLELSSLEVESLEVLVCLPESEQDSTLDTLTTMQGEIEVATLWTSDFTTKIGDDCCCCCTACCCCC
jgi:hypothetical protein